MSLNILAELASDQLKINTLEEHKNKSLFSDHSNINSHNMGGCCQPDLFNLFIDLQQTTFRPRKRSKEVDFKSGFNGNQQTKKVSHNFTQKKNHPLSETQPVLRPYKNQIQNLNQNKNEMEKEKEKEKVNENQNHNKNKNANISKISLQTKKSEMSAKEAFLKIVDCELVDYFLEILNEQLKKIHQVKKKKNKKLKQKVINRQTLLSFFSVIIKMGIFPKTDLKKYWAKKPWILVNKFIKKQLSRDLFLSIHRCWNECSEDLVDNILKMMKTKFQKAWDLTFGNQNQNQNGIEIESLDQNNNTKMCKKEKQMSTKNEDSKNDKKCIFVIMLEKKHKPIYLKALPISCEFAYVYSWDLYYGNEKIEELTLSQLLSKIPKSNESDHNLQVFTNHCCGSLKNPKFLTSKRNRFHKTILKNETIIFFNRCCASLSREKNPIYYLNTCHQKGIQQKQSQDNRKHVLEDKEWRNGNENENGNGNGRENGNEKIAHHSNVIEHDITSYLFPHKHSTWKRAILYLFFKALIHNAKILQEKCNNQKMTLVDFMQELSDQLSTNTDKKKDLTKTKKITKKKKKNQ
ncbi:piggybac transposable element-derived protein [Anaeramoeba flamelloides]|uniref:Piggybac transposable element-derived protein n=1 Tax=Anaeramoeba flamelloides TaxID=1746091 RepID=A0ABQ8XJ14_9EUKA|nr:piggybac transposable element-derived protein [Anaeramoeba flamelloides]